VHSKRKKYARMPTFCVKTACYEYFESNLGRAKEGHPPSVAMNGSSWLSRNTVRLCEPEYSKKSDELTLKLYVRWLTIRIMEKNGSYRDSNAGPLAIVLR
jgi:hypothetical protein